MTGATSHHRWQQERAWLGYAGLVPVLAGVGLLATAADAGSRALGVDLLRYYAAVIASFLGAVHWGAATPEDPRRLARLRWGVMPALIAWTLLLLRPDFGFAGFAVLFTLILGVDRYLLPLLDDAYRALRLRLSLVVIGLFVVAAYLAAPEVA